MEVLVVIGELVAVALLVNYLFDKHEQREHKRSLREDQAKWTGRAIEASELISTVDTVRHDYLATRKSPQRSVWYRRGLLAAVGRAVGQLAYFRDRKSEDDAHKHAT